MKKLNLIKVENYQEMSQRASSIILDLISKKSNPVLGLATGSTPEGMYQCLIKAYEQGDISFKNVTTFNLDEYVGLTKEDANSYHSYMKDKLFNHIDILPDQTHLPDGTARDLQLECVKYEQLIRDAGQVDIQVLGLGLNGHIGFNEPGTPFSSRTQVVELMASTRQANARFFNGLNEVPTQAITMGIETIMESERILLLVSGEKKAPALARLMKGDLSEDFPASILQRHPNVVIITDQHAC